MSADIGDVKRFRYKAFIRLVLANLSPMTAEASVKMVIFFGSLLISGV